MCKAFWSLVYMLYDNFSLIPTEIQKRYSLVISFLKNIWNYIFKINNLPLLTSSSNPYPLMSAHHPPNIYICIYIHIYILGVKSVFLTEYESSFKSRQPKRLFAFSWSVLMPTHPQSNSKPRLWVSLHAQIA